MNKDKGKYRERRTLWRQMLRGDYIEICRVSDALRACFSRPVGGNLLIIQGPVGVARGGEKKRHTKVLA